MSDEQVITEKVQLEANLVVRVAQQIDAEQLSLLNQEFNDSAVSARQIADYLANCPDHEKTVVAEIDGDLVGFACLQVYRSWCYPDVWAELTEMFVKPDFQRKGIGQAIVQHVEELAKYAGAVEIGLLTGKRNIAGQSLYRKCGYIEEAKCVFSKKLMAES